MSKNLYMVPFDFTEVGQKALDYTLAMASYVALEIKILHIAKDKSSAMAAKTKLEELAKNIKKPEDCDISTLVKVGNFLTDIGKIASEEKAQLVVMGTHGSSGMQKIMGSYAMKVITSAECPFLIVQKNTKIKYVNNILVPIDLTKESLQIINVAADMSYIAKSQITIAAERQNDPLLSSRLKNRLGLIKEQLEERGIEPKIKLFDQKGGFDSKIIKYSKSANMDMIAFAYHSESLFAVLDTFGQKLITNKHALPVLVLNSKQASALYF